MVAWLLSFAPAQAFEEAYTNVYRFLTFFHATVSQSATYWTGLADNWGWLSAYGSPYDVNTWDRWRQITWDKNVTLTGIRVEAWHQRTGGSIGTYYVQTSTNGVDSWTNVPTSTVFSNANVTYDVTFTTSVQARAVRVFFPAGNYDMGSGGFGGPGVLQFWARGIYDTGINPKDPQFNILLATGFQGVNPVVTFPVRVPEEGGAANLKDSIITADSGRTGWYPPSQTNAVIQTDLGPSPSFDHLWVITGVRLYAGSFYYYIPTSLDLSLSENGSTWPVTLTMSMTNGVLTATNINIPARYVRLAEKNPPSAWNNGYYLVHELSISAYALHPKPGTIIMLK